MKVMCCITNSCTRPLQRRPRSRPRYVNAFPLHIFTDSLLCVFCSILTLYALLFLQIEKSKRLKEDRKATQEANVKRKREAEAEKRQAKIDRKRRKIEGASGEQEGGVDSDSGSDNDGGDVDDDENQYGEYDGIENDGEYSGEEDDDSDQE